MPAAFVDQIKFLVELQKVDSEIYHLRKELATHPDAVKQLETGFEAKKAGLKTVEVELKALQVRQKDQENDLLAKEEKIKKLQAQLYQLKTNKEYSAMELEIKGLKADKSVLEEEIIRLLDTVDQGRERLAKEKERLSGDEKVFREAVDAVRRRGAEIEARLKALDGERKAHAPDVEKRYLTQYEKLLKGCEGLAIVPVQSDACGGCHMELPPQVVNEIRGLEKWITCEQCARILYWVS
jgi:uncharacterized protein